MQRKWQQIGTKMTSKDRYAFSNDDKKKYIYFKEFKKREREETN